MPKNCPPSLVASMKACLTMSAEMAPLDISSLSSPILLPVLSAITASGEKPALIICKRSCPINFPTDCICEKDSVSAWNFCASPIEMSPIALSIGIISSGLTLKPSIVCAPLARSFSWRGVAAANSFICRISSALACWLPRRVRNDTSRACISLRTLTTCLMKAIACCAEKAIPIALPTPRRASRMRLLSSCALCEICRNLPVARCTSLSSCEVSRVTLAAISPPLPWIISVVVV